MKLLSELRVALVLPPTQSFLMPYCAPATLAAWLQNKYAARTLVVDGGIDWLLSELAILDPCGTNESRALAALRNVNTYRDVRVLQQVFNKAQYALSTLCAPWAPEQVNLSGKYFPPEDYPTWSSVDKVLELSKPRLLDRYFEQKLIPKLRRFRPDIIGLSVPFDWMIFPTMRLVRWLRRSLPDVQTVVGGHAVNRLWHEGQLGFFDVIHAHWAAISDGERALAQLVDYICDGTKPPEGSPLVKLPPIEPILRITPRLPEFLSAGLVPDFSDLDLSQYLRPQPILPVPASEGCFYGLCRFCSRQRSDQSVPYHERTPDDVAQVMKHLAVRTGTRQFILAEDILTHRFLLSLSRALEADHEDLIWFCEATFKSSMAGKLSLSDCQLLYRGGCRIILNGLESGSSRIRNLMGCPIQEEKFDQTLLHLVKADIIPYVTLVIGYPGETLDDLVETVRFVKKHLAHAVFAMSRFQIVPGTPLSQELLHHPDSVCRRSNVLDSGMEYEAPDTLGSVEASEFLSRELGGMFGAFPEFLRSIPVLMQMLAKNIDSGDVPAVVEHENCEHGEWRERMTNWLDPERSLGSTKAPVTADT